MYRYIINKKYNNELIIRNTTQPISYDINTVDSFNEYNDVTLYVIQPQLIEFPETLITGVISKSTNTGILFIYKDDWDYTIVYDLLVEDIEGNTDTLYEDRNNLLNNYNSSLINYHKLYLEKDADNFYQIRNIVNINDNGILLGQSQYDCLIDEESGLEIIPEKISKNLTFFKKKNYFLKSDGSLSGINVSFFDKNNNPIITTNNFYLENTVIIVDLYEFPDENNNELITMKIFSETGNENIVLEVW